MGIKVTTIDLGMNEFLKQVKTLKKQPSVEVGVFSDLKVRNPPKDKKKKYIDNVELMAIHEFGTTKAGKNRNITIPQRSVIRSATEENKDKANKFILKEYDMIIKGKNTFNRLFKIFGTFMENKFKLKFTDGTLQANAPSTIRQKGSSQPLIDTAQLKQSIKSRVIYK